MTSEFERLMSRCAKIRYDGVPGGAATPKTYMKYKVSVPCLLDSCPGRTESWICTLKGPTTKQHGSAQECAFGSFVDMIENLGVQTP